MIKRVLKRIVTESDTLSSVRRRISVYKERKTIAVLQKDYFASEYPEKIRNLKDIHKGERCFVIGNGPSLNPQDLNLIKGEYSFGTNLVWIIYDKTEWRPTYYLCQDWKCLKTVRENANELPGTKLIGYAASRMQDISIPDAICYLQDKIPVLSRSNDMPMTYECDKCVVDGASVTISAIQFAVYMGFSEIYLLGCDNNYRYNLDKNKRLSVNEELKDSHFDERYEKIANKVNNGEITAMHDFEMTDIAFKALRKSADARGVKIINATRGGKLEVFERKSLEEVLHLP